MRPLIALAIGTALWSLLTPLEATASVDLVVVEVRGAHLSPGDTVDSAKPLSLKDGQLVTLISPAGKIIKLRGPSDQPPGGDETGASTDVNSALEALVTQKIARNDKAGVVRGTGTENIPPEPWLLDVTRPGNRCLPADSPIIFWRPGHATDETFVVAPSDRSWRATADWPQTTDRLTLPRTVPLPARSSYVVKLGKKEVMVTLISLPLSLTNDAMRAAWMMEEGCDAQAAALLHMAIAAPRPKARVE